MMGIGVAELVIVGLTGLLCQGLVVGVVLLAAQSGRPTSATRHLPPCPACGQGVSPAAPSCPHCGHPLKPS